MKTLILGHFLALVTISLSLLNAAPEEAAPATFSPTHSLSAQPGESPAPASNRMAPIPTEARRMALEVAGAFQNEGFRIRDGEWSGSLNKGTPLFLSLTLFAGESYWFVAASTAQGATLRVTLYDSLGKALKTEQWKDDGHGTGPRCAAGIASDQSGRYFVSVELVESPTDLPAEFTLIYAYK